MTIAGVLAGLSIAGSKMSSSILGKLVSPTLPGAALLSGLVVSIVLLIALTLAKIPVSLSNCVVGAFLGAGLASHTTIKYVQLAEIIGSWIAIPFVSAALAIVFYELLAKYDSHFSLITVSYTNRIVLVIVVFLVAFTLGANNIGTIVSLANGESLSQLVIEGLYAFVFLASAVGMVVFGKSIAGVISDEIVGLSQMKTLSAMLSSAIITGFFTALSIPVSLTQVIVGGMLGAGVVHKPSIVNRREVAKLIAGWTVVTLASAGLAFGTYFLFLRLI